MFTYTHRTLIFYLFLFTRTCVLLFFIFCFMFSQVGLIALNPADQLPRIKLYRNEDGGLKGDCSICYNALESVEMAVDVLSGGYIRPTHKITVTKADFSNSGGGGGGGGGSRSGGYKDASSAIAGGAAAAGGASAGGRRPRVSNAQMKVAAAAMRQALSWNEDDDIGVSRSQALKIVILQGLFQPADLLDPSFEAELEADVAEECSTFGVIDKMTIFAKNPRGVIMIKFSTSFAAEACIKKMEGRFFGGRRLRCFYWDGSTDYSVVSTTADQEEVEEKEEEKRLDEFGDWLEHDQEDLPDEFKLRVES